nr:MAG TPA: hypothetical protein [Caudoviricetes sp.]
MLHTKSVELKGEILVISYFKKVRLLVTLRVYSTYLLSELRENKYFNISNLTLLLSMKSTIDLLV